MRGVGWRAKTTVYYSIQNIVCQYRIRSLLLPTCYGSERRSERTYDKKGSHDIVYNLVRNVSEIICILGARYGRPGNNGEVSFRSIMLAVPFSAYT